MICPETSGQPFFFLTPMDRSSGRTQQISRPVSCHFLSEYDDIPEEVSVSLAQSSYASVFSSFTYPQKVCRLQGY